MGLGVILCDPAGCPTEGFFDGAIDGVTEGILEGIAGGTLGLTEFVLTVGTV